MILGIRGANKTGKTTLGLTFPKRIRHYDFDLGFDRAAPRFQADVASGLIVSKRYPIPPQGIYQNPDTGEVSLRRDHKLSGIREVWEEFIQDYVKALGDPEILTHMLDTSSQGWEVCHRAFLQEKQELQKPGEPLRERLLPVEYGEPNARMKAVIYSARTYGRNLVLTHYEREVYEERLTERGMQEVRTGRFELEGFKYTGGLVDMLVVTFTRDNAPYCTVELCGLDLGLQGTEIKEPSYESIMRALEMLK